MWYQKFDSYMYLTTWIQPVRFRPVHVYSTIGSLMYMMVATRPDLAYEVGATSRYMCNPEKSTRKLYNVYSGTYAAMRIYN